MSMSRFLDWIRPAMFVLASAPLLVASAPAGAQTASQSGLDKGQYIPNIWVDPDGCEHWVMDDGIEGYMTPHVTRDGLPVCREGSICAVVRTDQFFDTDSSAISSDGAARLRDFFLQSQFKSFSIAGHTDSVASDAYNLKLSRDRANAVAAIARTTGVRIASVAGYGERKPSVSNDTARGRAKNRRVEIMCIR